MPSALLSSISDVFPAEPGDIYLQDKGKPACLIRALTPKALASWRETLVGPHLTWMDTTHFAAAAGEVLLLPNSAGDLEAVLLGLGAKPDAFALASLPAQLPEGAYRLDDSAPEAVKDMAHLAWAMGCYRYEAYKTKPRDSQWPRLVLPKTCDRARVERLNRAVYSTRHLINTPAADMGPEALEQVMHSLAKRHKLSLIHI